MEKQDLDYVFVPFGVALMVAYHIWLFYRVIRHPTKTVMGINAINRRIWVHTMMEDTSKNGILVVQTLRNNIMASTVLASTAILLSSLIGILMANGGTDGPTVTRSGLVYGNRSELGFSIKCFSIMVCFLVSFIFNVQSIRYYSHACILINVGRSPHLSPQYVATGLNKAGYFWSLGLRALYFSFPIFLWIFGPIPMFLSCLALVFLLYFLDGPYDWAMNGNEVVGEESK